MTTETLIYATPSTSSNTRRLFFYFGPLTLLVFLVAPENLLAMSPANGFLYCVVATTDVYALILPLIPWTPWIPKQLMATADGEPNPSMDAAVLAEIESASVVGKRRARLRC